MSRNPKLNDLQLILLASAIQRDDGSILPVPENIRGQEERIRKVIPPLLRRGMIKEVPVTAKDQVWRGEDEQRIGLVITEGGRTILGAQEVDGQPLAGADEAAPAEPQNKPAPTARSGSKAEQVLSMLHRPGGATLNELVEATGWQPHTTRAALTGLRKKGHTLEKSKRDDATCYRIGEAA
jgi:hypothetical protein